MTNVTAFVKETLFKIGYKIKLFKINIVHFALMKKMEYNFFNKGFKFLTAKKIKKIHSCAIKK